MHLALFLLQGTPDQAMIGKMALAFVAILPIVLVVGLALVIIPSWFICKKAGFNPWLSLLIAVPPGGLILLYILAFSNWKVVPAAHDRWAPPPAQPPQN